MWLKMIEMLIKITKECSYQIINNVRSTSLSLKTVSCQKFEETMIII